MRRIIVSRYFESISPSLFVSIPQKAKHRYLDSIICRKDRIFETFIEEHRSCFRLVKHRVFVFISYEALSLFVTVRRLRKRKRQEKGRKHEKDEGRREKERQEW